VARRAEVERVPGSAVQLHLRRLEIVAELLAPFDANRDRIFLNRGDGDGPVNL